MNVCLRMLSFPFQILFLPYCLSAHTKIIRWWALLPYCCFILLLGIRSESSEENKSAIGLLLLHLLQNLPMTSRRTLKNKVHVSLSYQPNSKRKVQLIHSEPSLNLFNTVLYVQSGNLKDSIWLSWPVVQLWWASRSRCTWNLLAWNIHRIFLAIDFLKK